MTVTMTEIDPDALLTREAVAKALTDTGYPTEPATLKTKASRGGGPPYSVYGGRALYRWADAIRWAREQAGSPCRTASEHRARNRAA